VEYKNKLYVRKRGARDIWENLYEFILIEDDKNIQLENIAGLKVVKEIFRSVSFEVTQISPVYKQLLTHQTIQGQFIKVKIQKKLEVDDYELFTAAEIDTLPFPKFITAYLKDKNVSLNLF
jgi:A/G-specific adenine glycosylase